MRFGRFARVLAVAVVAGLVGYLAGPPIAQAAAGLVKITTGTKASEAKVAKTRLLIDTEAGVEQGFFGKAFATVVDYGLVFTLPNGANVMASGTGSDSSVCSDLAIVNSITVDGPATGTATVEVTGDTDGDSVGGDPVWQGTVAAGGHLNDEFDGGVFEGPGALAVTVTGGSPNWYVYGLCFGAAAASPALKALIRSHQR